MIFGINTTSDIPKLLYVISRAVRRVKFEAILKYHEWYLCQISRTNHGIRDFKIQRRGRQRERQKTIGLINQTTSYVNHAFLYISFPFLHDYDVKMPNFAFYRGLKQAATTTTTTTVYFSV